MSVFGGAKNGFSSIASVSSSAVTTLLGENFDRLNLTLYNISTGTILVGFNLTPTSSVYSYALSGSSAMLKVDSWQGAVYALASSSGCSVTAFEVAVSTG